MKKLYFLRHGLTVMNVEGKWSGTTETPLTPEGRDQAKRAGQQAKGLDIDYIVASPLGRARETAEIIAREIGYPAKDIHYNDLFIERHFGALEGQPWQPDLDMDGIADIESVDTLLNRARLALEFLHTIEAQHILVVSHGSFGRAMRSLLHEDKPYHVLDRLNNAELHQWL
jgi:probable phosphoglycerate mutase